MVDLLPYMESSQGNCIHNMYTITLYIIQFNNKISGRYKSERYTTRNRNAIALYNLYQIFILLNTQDQ